MSLALLIFSKNQLLALLIFATVSFVYLSFISCPNFYDLFPSTNPVVLYFFFFLMSLANGLSILFIFSKNQLVVLLIFTILSFVSFSLFYAPIFMISFLLLTLGLFISSFSNCFRCKVRLFV